MDFLKLIKNAIEKKASDIHIMVGIPPVLRIDGVLAILNEENIIPKFTEDLVHYILDEKELIKLRDEGEVDTSFPYPGIAYCRINAYMQQGNYGLAIRLISLEIPTMEKLGLPKTIKDFAMLPRGLVLITGPTGSGKSTTLASMINEINKEKSCHILTLEDPIEYVHRHNNSIINQREIGVDTKSFSNALRAGLRQDPDVILVGEMRDLETMNIAITAAETGHLVLSTLHTLGAAKTIDRIIGFFPSYQQKQIRMQFSTVIQGIVSQQLIPKIDGIGRVVALEIMLANPAIRNLIREGKIHHINSSIQIGGNYGMQTMDNSLIELYKKKAISKHTLLDQAIDPNFVKSYI